MVMEMGEMELAKDKRSEVRRLFRSACPLDCFDACALVVEIEEAEEAQEGAAAHGGGRQQRDARRVVIKGSKDHPITQGFLCVKGKKWLERTTSPDRVTTPLVRRDDGELRPASWDEALNLVAGRLRAITDRWGATAILHIVGDGSGGILKNLDRRFMNALGGVTTTTGSLCWGSGIAAQRYDFGAHASHDWDDLANSRLILLWGRQPAVTNVHLLPFLRRAYRGVPGEGASTGLRVISINPARIEAPGVEVEHFAARPGTDGALALGMGHVIISEGWVDEDFVAARVKGFPEYARRVEEYGPERVAAITDLGPEEIRRLARLYATTKPAAILFGYGMQRYVNGGNTVRAIDALAAITGNVGVAGGGANYASYYWSRAFADISGPGLATAGRHFPVSQVGRHMLAATDPPVEAVIVTRANPATQMPNAALFREAMKKVGFRVVVDHFLTDSALMADVFLPCTTVLEEEDIVYTSWHHFASYAEPVLAPRGEARSEVWIFTELAKRLGVIDRFDDKTAEEWLREAVAPLAAQGVTLEDFRREGVVRCPEAPPVAWADGGFQTPSGKIELSSEVAAREGLEAVADYFPSRANRELGPDRFFLVTPHARDQLHSQYFNLGAAAASGPPKVLISARVAACGGVADGDAIMVVSQNGRLSAVASVCPGLRDDVVQIPEGYWHRGTGGASGAAPANGVGEAGVNFLTPDLVADMGQGTPFYDVVCRLIRNGKALSRED